MIERVTSRTVALTCVAPGLAPHVIRLAETPTSRARPSELPFLVRCQSFPPLTACGSSGRLHKTVLSLQNRSHDPLRLSVSSLESIISTASSTERSSATGKHNSGTSGLLNTPSSRSKNEIEDPSDLRMRLYLMEGALFETLVATSLWAEPWLVRP